MKRARNDDESQAEMKDPPSQRLRTSSVTQTTRRKCPYLDTVNRQLLDFDMEKLCSVTLTNMNVYACLVCGKFFQGRGQSTPAYTHSVHCGHFVFINLHTTKAYCLPDNYEIIDSSLDDVKRCLDPHYSLQEIRTLSQSSTLARDVHGVAYLPGFVGLNNLSKTDYVNVTLNALAHISPLRNFFLDPSNYSTSKCPVVHKFGEVMRKIWSKHNFKSVVSPQEFLQVVSTESKKRFSIGTQCEAIEFLAWLLNKLHIGLGGTRKRNSSIVYSCFQGIVEMTTLTRRKVIINQSEESTDDPMTENGSERTIFEDEETGVRMEEKWERDTKSNSFLYLTLDIPPTPLFKDSQGGLIIPQIPLFEVLKKIDGETWTDGISSSTGGLMRKQYSIKSLPRFLILHLNRFTKNNFYIEKNPTIVTFPVKNLEMKNYLHGNESMAAEEAAKRRDTVDITPDAVEGMSVKALKEVIRAHGNRTEVKASLTVVEKPQLKDIARTCLVRRHHSILENESEDSLTADTLLSTKYDLVANICHDSAVSQGVTIVSDSKLPVRNNNASGGSSAGTSSSRSLTGGLNVLEAGSYRAHVQNKGTGQWFELQDLHVMETMPQLIGLSESYMLIYEKKPTTAAVISSAAEASEEHA